MPFGPGFSFVSLFSFRSCRTRYSCFSGFSRRSYGTLRTFLSFWSPPAAWSPRSNGTRIPGGPAGQTFSPDLQYLVDISCSNCLLISFLTSCMVMPVEVSFKLFLRFLTRMVANAFIGNGLTALK